jgi:DNA-binding CsgD family transcriptional regulator
MSNPPRSSRLIWLIQIESSQAKGVYRVLPKEVYRIVRRASLPAALKLLERGIQPAVIFLAGNPGNAMQDTMARINEVQPALPVLVISRWQTASDMRSWFSHYLIEAARATPSTREERINAYRLSSRELDILSFMVKGLIKKEIAEQLSISYHTVDNHERNIFRKMNIHTRSAAVAKALIERIC